jgi:hypothetical protein
MSETFGWSAGVVATACVKEEIWRNTGSPDGERTQLEAREGQIRAGRGGGQARSVR